MVTRAYDEALTPVGLGVNQYAVLATLERSRPQVLQDLARSLAMDRSTLGHLLRPLESRGLVEITVGTMDGRKRVAALSEAGRMLVTTARPLWTEAQNRFEQAFGDAAAEALRTILARVVAIQTLPTVSGRPAPIARREPRHRARPSGEPAMSQPSPTIPRRLNYAWVVMGITFAVLLVGAGIRATPGILIVPLEREFGWSDATISSAIAVNILLYGLLGPFAVAVMERFGLRRTVVTALLILAIGVASTALMTTPWQLVILWGIVVGSGTGMIAIVLGATVANRWFIKNKGLVLGLLTASSATGQLVFLPLLASLGQAWGWRAVSLTVAGPRPSYSFPS